MAGEDWLAAIAASLESGAGGLQFMRRAKQEEEQRKAMAERQRQQDALAAQEREERRADRDELRRGRERATVSGMLEEIGRGGRLAPEQALRARDLDLGHRLEDTPDFQHSYFAQAGPVPMMVPDVATTVAPTAAERLADQERRKEQERRASIASGIADPYERQAFEADPTKYKPTRDSFVPLPIRQREATEAEDAKIGAEVRKGEALLPIKLREKEEGERIEARYRPPPASGPGPTKIVQGTDDEGRPVSYLIDREGNIVKSFGRPVSSADQRAATEADASARAVQDIRTLYKPEYVGPVQGRLNKLSSVTGFKLTPEKAKFSAAVAHMKNEMIRELTGAAVGVQEEGRIMGEIPDETNPPALFEARLEQTEKNRKFLRERAAARAGGRSAPSGAGAPDPRGGKTLDPLGIR
jgi:hypothetical protein